MYEKEVFGKVEDDGFIARKCLTVYFVRLYIELFNHDGSIYYQDYDEHEQNKYLLWYTPKNAQSWMYRYMLKNPLRVVNEQQNRSKSWSIIDHSGHRT